MSSMVKYLAAAASHHALLANSDASGGVAALVCYVDWEVVVIGRLEWQRARQLTRQLMLMRRNRNATTTGKNNALLDGTSSSSACSRRRGLRYWSVMSRGGAEA